jgi:hypothetical protein
MVINSGSLVRHGNSGKKIFSFPKDSQFWYRIGNCISPSVRHCVAYKMRRPVSKKIFYTLINSGASCPKVD